MEEANEVGNADALSVLPNEIWEIILGKLESSKDLLSCLRAFKVWEVILERTKTNWLLNEIFGLIYPYLGTNEILNCRLVSSKWCEAVDSFLEFHPSRPVYNEDYPLLGQRSDVVSPLEGKNMQWIVIKNLDQFKPWENTESDRNPFPGRSIWLEIDTDAIGDVYSRLMIADFFGCFGDNVWHLVLQVTGSSNTYMYFINLVQELTAIMGNLKSLRILGRIADVPNPIIPKLLLESFLDVPRRFYTIPSLESLEITNCSKLPEAIQRQLIKIYSGQLKRLNVTDFDVFNRLTFLPNGIPNLKELHLNVKSIKKLDRLLKKLKASPLSKLTLNFTRNCAFWSSAEELLATIGQFGNTLRYLRMKSQPTEPIMNCGKSTQPDFNAPHLQTLELEGFVSFSLHFLKGMGSLEYLFIKNLSLGNNKWFFIKEDDKALYEHILGNRLYEHTIWQELPALKKVVCENPVGSSYLGRPRRFEKHFYTRVGYEQFASGNKVD